MRPLDGDLTRPLSETSLTVPNQQQRQLALRFYSKWYCAKWEANVVARRFRLALTRSLFSKVIIQGIS